MPPILVATIFATLIPSLAYGRATELQCKNTAATAYWIATQRDNGIAGDSLRADIAKLIFAGQLTMQQGKNVTFLIGKVYGSQEANMSPKQIRSLWYTACIIGN